MSLKFNINRPKISDEEINKHQDFDTLVQKFKKQSVKKARGDESWWKNKRVQYSTVIAGITVVCTITYQVLFKQQTNQTLKNDKTSTLVSHNNISPKKKTGILAPSAKLAVPFTSYTLKAANGGTLSHTGGSKIKVPKNSFVNKNGQDIVGDVTIEYREFHDLGDVIASGIPMQYDSAGISRQLESAGMFDIKGYQNGEPVFIKATKHIQVDLASKNSENKFHQYYFDTLSNNWNYIKSDELTAVYSKSIIPAQQAIPESPTKTKVEQLKLLVQSSIPKQIDSIKSVATKKIALLPRVIQPQKPVKETPGRPTFKIEGSYEEYPELSAFDNVLFEVGKENKNYSSDLHEITWSEIKITPGPEKGKNYILNLGYRTRFEKLIVYPVLSGADYEKAVTVYDTKYKTYLALAEKRKAEEMRLLQEMQAKETALIAEQQKKQKELLAENIRLQNQQSRIETRNLSANLSNLNILQQTQRMFQISQFGIYNSDCPHTPPQGNSVNPMFVLAENEKYMAPNQSYLIDHTSKCVYMLDSETGFRFNYTSDGVYSLCLFKGGKLFICNKETFHQCVQNKSNKFLLKGLPPEADNLIDFKKYLEI